MICPNCGSNMNNNYNFCTNCGIKIKVNELVKVGIINEMIKKYLKSNKRLLRNNSPFIKYDYNPFLLSLLKERKEDVIINQDFEYFEELKYYNHIIEYKGFYISYYDLLRLHYYI